MTDLDAARAVQDRDLRDRTMLAMAKYSAQTVLVEDPLTANHASRLVLALAILKSADPYVTEFVLCVLTNPTNQAEANAAAIPDADLEFAVNGAFNNFI